MKTKNLTILFTDIVGYTAATAQQSRKENEDLLATHNRILFPVFRKFGGRLVKMIGDALLIVFTSPTDAMLCAMAMQDALFDYNRSTLQEKQIHIRIAASLGEVRVTNKDIFGEPVNLASRIESLTPQDEIYLSDAVYMTMNKSEVPCIEVGVKELKGVANPIRIWQIPRFCRPRLVPEDVMGSADISDLAYPYGGAHLRTEGKSKLLLGSFDSGGKSLAVAGGTILLLILFGIGNLLSGRSAEGPIQQVPTVIAPAFQTALPPASPDQLPAATESPPLTMVKASPAPVSLNEPALPAAEQKAAAEPKGMPEQKVAQVPLPNRVPDGREPQVDPAITRLKQDLRAENSAIRRRAIKTIARLHSHDKDLLERVEAELLKGYNLRADDRDHVDAIAWMCKVLASSGESRFRKTLDLVATRASNPKIRKYAEKSRSMLN